MTNSYFKYFLYFFALISVFFYQNPLSFAEQLRPNTYFYPEGANEYFIKLLQENSIPYGIELDGNKKIEQIYWNVKNNRKALEQALKVNQKIGATKTPESIKMFSPEMNDRFEKILKANNIPFWRKGEATYYEWKFWVEVEMLKRKFWKEELEKNK